MGVHRRCEKCGFERDLEDGLPKWRCPKCEVVYPEVKDVNRRAFDVRSEHRQKRNTVILTTETYAPDLIIKERIGIVTSECVFGMNVLRDALSAVSDIAGGRSKTTQRGLREARETCLNELREQAKQIGANAVVAIDLDYSEFSGGGVFGEKSMLFLVASGTAVKLEHDQLPDIPSETGLNPFSIE